MLYDQKCRAYAKFIAFYLSHGDVSINIHKVMSSLRDLSTKPPQYDQVVLFKSKAQPQGQDNDPYIQQLAGAGYTGSCIPVLEFQYKDIEKYSQLLSAIHNYSAIVFTSQQAVKATQFALDLIKDDEKQKVFCDVKCYVVGKATADAASKLGFSTNGSNSGNAEILSSYIANDLSPSDKPLLFPCGNIRKDILPSNLKSNGFVLEEMVVYKTMVRDGIYADLKKMVDSQLVPGVLVFFSPSGVQALQKILASVTWFPFHEMKIIALGPSTEVELEKHGLQVYGTLEKPDPENLLKILRK